MIGNDSGKADIAADQSHQLMALKPVCPNPLLLHMLVYVVKESCGLYFNDAKCMLCLQTLLCLAVPK